MPNGSIPHSITRISNRLRNGSHLFRGDSKVLSIVCAAGIAIFLIVALLGWLYKVPSLLYLLLVIGLVITNTVTYFWAENLLVQKEKTSVPVSEHKLSKDRIDALNSITGVLANSESVPIAMTELIALICNAFHWDFGSFWKLDKDRGVLQCVTVWHNTSIKTDTFEKATKAMHYAIGMGLPGKVWRSREEQWIDDVTADMSFLRTAAAEKDGLRSAFAMPVLYGDRFLGVLEFFSQASRLPDDNLVEMFTSIGSQVGQFVHHTDVQGALRENEMLFRQLAENLKVVFWISSPGGFEFYYVSPAFEELTGHSCNEVYARPELLVEIMVPEDRKLAIRHAKEDLNSKTGTEGEYRIMHPDGTIRWILARTFPVTDEHDKLFRICGIGQDITERKEAEKRVSEFYSTVSHELRTPLTSIRGSLGLMEGGLAGELPEKARRFIEIARSESDRLIRLINDILDLRKIEAGKLELRMADVSASQLVQSSIDALRGMAHEANVQLVTTITKSGSMISCDRDRIIQVLTNLLSNAIKYSPSGTDVELTVALNETGKIERFSIKDSGAGIAANQIPRLFGKFQQLDSSDTRAKGGTGLGLAICKAIVEQHGGHIGVETAPGKGSTFWFELPALDTQPESASSPLISGSHPALLNRGDVLLIEDDPSTRSVLVDLLNSVGIKCLEARDGKTGLQMTKEHSISLIILDLWIPPPNGFELVEILRQGNHRITPLLVYTGHDLTEEDRRNLTLGKTKHLIKTKSSQVQFLEAVQVLLRAAVPATAD